MPVNKSALIRYRIIDACLTNKYRRYPTLEFIKEKIDDAVGDVSESMISKDFSAMKDLYNAPIRYDRYRKGYLYDEEGFTIKEFPRTANDLQIFDFTTALLNQFKGTPFYAQCENAIKKVMNDQMIKQN